MDRKKIMLIFGTRPEAIKMAPVVMELNKHREDIEPLVCVTSQHKQMLTQVLDLFGIEPDIDLHLMEENQSLESLTARAMKAVPRVLAESSADLVLVQGDTTTAMIAALAAFYQRIPVGHVEAGLRTEDRYNPFPEEINRRIISMIATYNFAPTKKSMEALLKENLSPKSIYLTGNTVIDALLMIVKQGRDMKLPADLDPRKKILLVTAHRRENFGRPLKNICCALRILAERNKDIEIVYPVHLNPNVKGPVYTMLSGVGNIRLIPPVAYHELVSLMKRSYLILTDSGGIQEEAPALGKPVLVMRIETERPEGIEAGVARLVGTDTENIVGQTEKLLHSEQEYGRMSRAVNPYGDGTASRRIVEIILKDFGQGCK